MADGGLVTRRALRINSGGALPVNPISSDVFLKTGSSAGYYYCLSAGAWIGPLPTSDVGAVWGSITGSLSNQTDLQSALDAKVSTASLQVKRLAIPFDKTDDTLESITSLATDVQAGGSYSFNLSLPITADASGGYKVALGGTATAIALYGQGFSYDSGNAKMIGVGTYSSLGSAMIDEAGTENVYITISGSVLVNTAGSFAPQFAQRSINGTSSALAGATFEIKRVG